MTRKLCGTEVLKTKDIAIIKNINIYPARQWMKEARKKLEMEKNAEFTLRHFSLVENIDLDELLDMLNKKFA